MRKYTIFIFGFLVLLLGVNRVSAECDYAKQAQLNAQVANMDFKYEFATRLEGQGSVDGMLTEVEVTYAKLYVYNLTEDLKMTLINSNTKQRTNYTYKDVKDGVIIIDTDDSLSEVVNYVFEIYPEDSTCGLNELRIHELKIPKFNTFTRWEMCDETPDFYLCQEFITVDKTVEEFVAERNDYLIQLSNDEKDNTDEDKGVLETITSFLNKYKFVLLGVVVVGGVATYVIIRKRRSRII